MKDWILQYNDWQKEEHSLRESLCTLGNGYFATRGALEFSADNEYNYPGTYLAGGYNRAVSRIKDKEIENEDLVNWPNWLYLTFKIGDSQWFELHHAEIIEYVSRLNIREGILERKIKFKDNENRETSIHSRRIVSMADPHVAGIEWTLIPENWSGEITIRSGINGNVINNNVERYSDLNSNHIEVLDTGHSKDAAYLVSQTLQSKIRMAQVTLTKLFEDEKEIKPEDCHNYKKENYACQDLKYKARKLQPVRIEKLVTLFTSRDFAVSDPLSEALEKIHSQANFHTTLEKHTEAWSRIWERSNFDVVTDDNDVLVLRLHISHIHQTISRHSIGRDIGVPSRGWHGEAYRGHIFWDELYIFPYINLHQPQLARSLLMYRYRRLSHARLEAERKGYRGAMFPWQSGSNGREESQEIHLNPKSDRWIPDNSRLQRHINAAIPYNVWQYFQATDDMEFMASYGAELILSTALFWSSIARFNPKRDKYEIFGVMGPDEYHTGYPESERPGLNNNAYTNFMAVWVIETALEVINMFDDVFISQLSDIIGFTKDDIETWKEMTTKMYIPFKDNIIQQFEGFDKLKELDWDKYRKKYGEIMRLDRILEKENDSPNNYRVSKQADVLMLFYLFSSDNLVRMFKRLGYEFKPEYIPENVDYYQKITSHGSTLSKVIHAWVYSRTDRERSWNNYKKALFSDIKDIQGGTTPEGIHLGAMAGTVDIIQRCYTGLEMREETLFLNPRLPKEIKEMNLYVRYRSHWIRLKISRKKLYIEFDKGWSGPIKIDVKGKTKVFESNDSAEFELK